MTTGEAAACFLASTVKSVRVGRSEADGASFRSMIEVMAEVMALDGNEDDHDEVPEVDELPAL